MPPKRGRPIIHGPDDPVLNRRRQIGRERARKYLLRKREAYAAVETLSWIAQQPQPEWIAIRPSDWEQDRARILLSLGAQAPDHLKVPTDPVGTRLQHQSAQYVHQGPQRALLPPTAQCIRQAPHPAQLHQSTQHAYQDPPGGQLRETTKNVDGDWLRAQLEQTKRRVDEILSTCSDGMPLDFFRQFAGERTSQSRRGDDHRPSPIAESSKIRQSARPRDSEAFDLHNACLGRQFAPRSIIGDLKEHGDGLQEHRDESGGHETSLEAMGTSLEITTTSLEDIEMRSRATQVDQKDTETGYAKIRGAAAARVTCRFRWPPLAYEKTR